MQVRLLIEEKQKDGKSEVKKELDKGIIERVKDYVKGPEIGRAHV